MPFTIEVLNLFRLRDHFVSVVSVRRPPLEIVPLAHYIKPYYATL